MAIHRILLPLFIALLVLSPLGLSAGLTASEYLPEGTRFNAKIPPPEKVLGFDVGDWHVRHDQLVDYLEVLARASDRVRIEVIGKTYAERPLVMLTISSPGNLGRLEKIRHEHLKLSQPGAEPTVPLQKQPLVVTMGYGVHGNESSASNAALLIAYYLAAAEGPEIERFLSQALILLDPCLNPDGLSRFANWANSHRGKHPVADANHREHQEDWPGGRTNYYWFDLNRDWLLAQHPESRARLRKYHQWRPNVMTDFHEMGSDSTYFFQPGVPSRTNPLTPEENVTLTAAFARYHARSLDREGVLYYTRERFDDYYYGKGSTYPDVHGGVGILFEQASSRGHLRESDHGELDFTFTIQNQVATSLSTLQAAGDLRSDLLQYQKAFYDGAIHLAEQDAISAYLVADGGDQARRHHLLDLLLRHQIEVYRLGGEVVAEGKSFTPEDSLVIPTRQAQFRLIKSLFEERTEFEDNIFYDVSAWTLPHAMGLPFAVVGHQEPAPPLGERITKTDFPAPSFPKKSPEATYAYAFEWHGYYAPRALFDILSEDLPAKVMPGPFSAETISEGVRQFDRGTIVIPAGLRPSGLSSANLQDLMARLSAAHGLKIHALKSGLTPEGIDLGSPSGSVLKPPKPLLVVGPGVSGYEAGEVWHLLDRRFDIPVVLVEHSRLAGIDLDQYTHVVMVGGDYSKTISKEVTGKLKHWIEEEGGSLVAIKSAAKWVVENGLAQTEFPGEEGSQSRVGKKARKGQKAHKKKSKPAEKPERLPYGEFEQINDAKRTGGAIFLTDLDLTHPLGYGYRDRKLAVFRNSNLFMKPSQNRFATVVQYAEDPLLSGYVHPENLAKLSGSASIVAERAGQGTVILMVDNPNFRAFWYGTNKLFLNALFFGPLIEPTKEEAASQSMGHQHHE